MFPVVRTRPKKYQHSLQTFDFFWAIFDQLFEKLLETFLGSLEQLVGFRLMVDFITTFWYPENFLYLLYYWNNIFTNSAVKKKCVKLTRTSALVRVSFPLRNINKEKKLKRWLCFYIKKQVFNSIQAIQFLPLPRCNVETWFLPFSNKRQRNSYRLYCRKLALLTCLFNLCYYCQVKISPSQLWTTTTNFVWFTTHCR